MSYSTHHWWSHDRDGRVTKLWPKHKKKLLSRWGTGKTWRRAAVLSAPIVVGRGREDLKVSRGLRAGDSGHVWRPSRQRWPPSSFTPLYWWRVQQIIPIMWNTIDRVMCKPWKSWNIYQSLVATCHHIDQCHNMTDKEILHDLAVFVKQTDICDIPEEFLSMSLQLEQYVTLLNTDTNMVLLELFTRAWCKEYPEDINIWTAFALHFQRDSHPIYYFLNLHKYRKLDMCVTPIAALCHFAVSGKSQFVSNWYSTLKPWLKLNLEKKMLILVLRRMAKWLCNNVRYVKECLISTSFQEQCWWSRWFDDDGTRFCIKTPVSTTRRQLDTGSQGVNCEKKQFSP